MSGLVRMGALPRLYSRLASRPIFTSAVRQYKPVPTTRPPYASELEALQVKEKGPWGELTKQEKIDLYKAQFVTTIPESKLQEPYAKKLVGLISGFLAVSVILFAFLRKYIGPEKPRTLTPEWEADSIKKAKRLRANPITGIGSRA
ncbi:cytochrome c oxidase subunit 4 isoform 2, mitochondrial-like [Montipora capricornis]|uniref:cytochrome c oxidase subunit 4 isoform 2, mitochondrial-like n=1 Tax=Montipora capricornis TaxID=246305 RepID=UPI0035F16655